MSGVRDEVLAQIRAYGYCTVKTAAEDAAARDLHAEGLGDYHPRCAGHDAWVGSPPKRRSRLRFGAIQNSETDREA